LYSFVLFSNFWAAVSAFALLSCSTVYVAALFLYWFIEQINDDDDDDGSGDHGLLSRVFVYCGVRCVVDQKKQIELADQLDLSSYLLKPVQRMSKYSLLLQQMMKQCPNTDPQYSQLTVHLTDTTRSVCLFSFIH